MEAISFCCKHTYEYLKIVMFTSPGFFFKEANPFSHFVNVLDSGGFLVDSALSIQPFRAQGENWSSYCLILRYKRHYSVKPLS